MNTANRWEKTGKTQWNDMKSLVLYNVLYNIVREMCAVCGTIGTKKKKPPKPQQKQ